MDERGKFSVGDKGKISMKEIKAGQEAEAAQERRTGFTETELKEKALKEKAERDAAQAAKKPKSEKRKKVENFFFHYRVHVIAGAVGVFLLAFFVRDMFFTPKTDLAIVVAGHGGIPSDYSDVLRDKIIPYATDFNGDGEVLLVLDAMSLPPVYDAEAEAAKAANPAAEGAFPENGGYPQAEYAGTMKLMALVASGTDHLFLLDERGYEYLTSTGEDEAYQLGTLFEVIGEGTDGIAIEDTALAGEDVRIFEGYKLYLRTPQNPEKIDENYYYCKELIERIIADKPVESGQ